MLFHLIMTHTADNCPGFLPPEKRAGILAEADKIPEIAKD